MLALKYSLILAALGLAVKAALDFRQTRQLPASLRSCLAAAIALLAGLSLQVVPAGSAGVRVSQLGGTLPGTLYSGTHFVLPLVQRIELFNVRDAVFQTVLAPPSSSKSTTAAASADGETLKVQTREGLVVGLAVAVRYRLDARRLDHIHANLPQPVDRELVPPVVASVFREIAPNYMVRELFSSRREEVRRTAFDSIRRRLAADAVDVREVMLRDILLPAEYAKGLEGLLLEEQRNERLGVEMEVKQKLVRAAELESDALKARQVKQAEADAQVVVLQAKAQADAMQYTLPLKEKQIQQTRLEAEARKESTVKQAQASAEAKVIDGKAELERRKMMNEAEVHRVQLMARADSDKLRLEAGVLKENPLLIQKIIAEKLSDKVQIMMVPNDGKYFFASDVLRGAAGLPGMMAPASTSAAPPSPREQ